jgi:hypothetical protein
LKTDVELEVVNIPIQGLGGAGDTFIGVPFLKGIISYNEQKFVSDKCDYRE